MLKKEAEQRQAIEMLCTDMLVPKGHLLRKIDAAVNFARIYELVEDLYCEDNGRPSCDPVVLFKLVLIQHLFGIRSLRQTMRDAEVNVAYRWFLGYTMSQQLPHFATISYAFRHRFTAEVIEGVFRWILEEVARAGYLSAEVVFVDGTHIKANANLKKQMKKAIPVAAKRYQEQLDEEIEADRAAHGKKPLKKDDDDDGPCASGKEKMVAESTTDPESGVFHKGEHKKCFAYEAHTACDRRGYILETEITPGNVHDSVAFDTVFERLKAHYPEVQVVTADAGYKTPWICKQIFDSGKIPSLPYKRPMTKKGNLPWYAYVYDEYYDCILCPQDKVLSYATTNREGYREYKSKSYICRDCPELEKCTQNRQYTKTVTRHIWQEYLERAEDIRHSPVGKATYALRSQTIERVFADAKEKHAMRYTPYRGLAAVTAWVKLKFAAMNLKKLALHKWRPFLLFYLHLLQEATSLRCNVASLTGCAAPKMRGGIALFTIIRRQHVKASLEAAREVAYAGKTHRSRYLRNGTLLFQQQAARHVQAVRIEIFAEAHAKVALKAAAEITLRIAQLGGNIAGGQIAGIAPGNAGRYPAAKILVQRGRGGAQSFQTGRQQRKHQHQMPACHQRPPGGMFLTGPDNRKQMIGYLRSDGILLFQHATKRRHVHIRPGKGRISVMQQRKIKANAVFTQWRGAVRSGFMGHKGRDENHLSCVDGQGFPVKGNDSVAGFQIQHLKFPVQMALVPSSGCHVIARAAGNIAGNGQLRKFGHKVLKIHAGPSLRVSVYHAQARPSRVRRPAIPFLYSLIACSLRSLTFMMY